ncbi:twin-arginine translocation signal domain-containing protein [Massilia sp. LXY-6]|uniref:twin-arginine translocation signal domain-containing protein n=1 Tax=Massilia sp. LXY-6 TaxID=3379823 RepID=UPI003EE26A52
METSRRSFLKAGALAALVLAAGGGIYRYTHPPAQSASAGFVIDGDARAALHALVPAILAGVLPTDPAERARAVTAATERVNQTILGLPLATQRELQDLFGLLALGPARRLLTGIPHGWAEAGDAQVGAWLQDWRTHRLSLLRSAYQALHDLVLGSWYSDSANWAAIGYPGPPGELA